MQQVDRIAMRVGAVAAISLAIGACSSDPNPSNVSLLPKPDAILKRPDWTTFSGAKSEFALRPVTSDDLVGAEGQCGFAGGEPAAGVTDPATATVAGVPQTAALVPGGIALQMTECDVVRRAGAPEKVDLGVDERGDRAVVLTYVRGPQPGVYRFAGGRLVSMERAPGAPPAAAKPQQPARTAKKPAGISNQ